jgi:mitogen-activated protein kinase 1/3
MSINSRVLLERHFNVYIVDGGPQRMTKHLMPRLRTDLLVWTPAVTDVIGSDNPRRLKRERLLIDSGHALWILVIYFRHGVTAKYPQQSTHSKVPTAKYPQQSTTVYDKRPLQSLTRRLCPHRPLSTERRKAAPPAMKPQPHSCEHRHGRQNDLLEHYDLHEELGSGAYGIVYLATQKISGQYVAIKVIRHLDNSLVCRRTLREVRYLQGFKRENIISLLDVARPDNIDNFSEACLIQEYMPQNLTQVIDKFELTELQISYLTHQMLLGLQAIHCADIIHRDVKPDNLLVGPNCELKICDFGLARAQSTSGTGKLKMTEYVATRWYRAPEVMLSRYDKASDVWSSGCVLAQMLGRRVIFPGSNYIDQLCRIFDVLGSPTDDDLTKARYSQKSIDYIRTALPSRPRMLWKDMFPKASVDSLDLVDRLLTFNMYSRITIEKALEHSFVRMWLDPDEASCKVSPTRQAFLDCDDGAMENGAKSEYGTTSAHVGSRLKFTRRSFPRARSSVGSGDV